MIVFDDRHVLTVFPHKIVIEVGNFLKTVKAIAETFGPSMTAGNSTDNYRWTLALTSTSDRSYVIALYFKTPEDAVCAKLTY
jgi:hypothetical protein